MPVHAGERVHVRTPTYRRADDLKRCLQSLQAQTWRNWVCDVYDDDREQSARAVCEALRDDRIRYNPNAKQQFASGNINQCFSRANPHDSDFFFVLEDDNYVFPAFMEKNIALAKAVGADVILRNQQVEIFGAGGALSETGVLNHLFEERLYGPGEFHLAVLVGIGVSNGGLFWSRHARSDFEIAFDCSAVLQEYVRTALVKEPVYVALEPLAAWAENGPGTTRDAGAQASWMRRELDLKKSVQCLQRAAWRRADGELRGAFKRRDLFQPGAAERATGLAKAVIWDALALKAPAAAILDNFRRGVLIAALGQVNPGVRLLAQEA